MIFFFFFKMILSRKRPQKKTTKVPTKNEVKTKKRFRWMARKLVLNPPFFIFFSRGGSDPDRPKMNQDASYVIQQEDGQLQAVVLDGHGKQGHLVSGAFRAVLLELLTSRPLPEAFLQGDESLRTLPGARASGAACIAALVARGAT